jgi:hypothetical protein
MRLADEIAASDVKLPEPAAPRGNGKAYAKFLAAYKAMQEPVKAEEPKQPVSPSTSVDANA